MSTFDFAPSYRIGNEAIAYQHDSALHNQLTDLVIGMRALGTYTQDIANREAAETAVFKASGISIRLDIVSSVVPNAGVYVPDLDKNHPILNNYMRGYRANTDLAKVLNFTNGKFVGVVDKKKGKFLGDFSKMRIPVFITTALLSNEWFSPGEVAAAIMHEVGHVASYFERILDITSMNYAAAYVAERILKTGTDVERIKLISEFEKNTNTVIRDKETIVESENGQAIFTHLVLEATKQRRNEEGDEVYSFRGFEFSSDQFVTRHGAGRDLSTLIAKLDNMSLGRSSQPWVLHIAIQLSLAGLAVAGIVMGSAAVGSIIMTFPNIQNIGLALLAVLWILKATGGDYVKIYDDPKERLVRIRNEMVGQLKEAETTAQREQLVHDIAFVTEAMKATVDKPTWYEFVRTYLPTDYRKEKNSREFQQTLEKLMNNDLFVAAATLESTV